MQPVVIAVLLSAVVSASAAAQTVSPGLEHANPGMASPEDRRDVERVVLDFLKKLGSRDVSGVRALLAPKALVAVVRQRDKAFVNTYQTGEEFIAQFEKNAGQPKFEEPITDVVITVDSGCLAYVRAPFTIVRDGKVTSSGIDHFTLLKEESGWKIALVAYTSLPATR